MNFLIEEAFRKAIITEKKSHDFYRQMARTISDQRISNLFELLAREEAEHMKTFVMRYPGDEFELLALVESLPKLDDPVFQEFLATANEGASIQRALEIALYEELDCLERYFTLVTCIREPGLRALFEHAMEDTSQHYAKIHNEYRRVTGKQDAGYTSPEQLPHPVPVPYPQQTAPHFASL